MSESHQSVIVVGAGPTGLLLAGDLAAAGVSVTLLDKRPEEISNLSRAFGVHARTLELLDARGIAEDLISTGSTITGLDLFGHLSLDLSTLASRFPYLLITPQYQVERTLLRRATELGVRFGYEHRVTGLAQDADGVDVRVETAAGPDTLRAGYVVGTDGFHSAVREAIGLPFPGVSVIKSLFLADVRLSDKPDGVLTVRGTGDAFAMIASFGDGWYRVMGWNRAHQVPDTEPLDFDEVRDVTRQAHGTDFGMGEPRWLSRFHSDERQAPHYRAGRVLLAGDAAHVHSPAGGQGMNTGIQDAANLGWKLAGAVHGWAPERLLDTYESERHPVGKAVLRSSGAIVRLARAHNPAARALRSVVTTVVAHERPIQHKALGQISGIGYEYDAPHDAHPLVGMRAPDADLSDGRRLYEALRDGMFLLITPESVRPDVSTRRDRVAAVQWEHADPAVQLIRPDGYVAWAADSWYEADAETALTEWAGKG